MARGGRVALQTVLGGLSGGLQGFQQAQARKKSEARQNIADLLAAEAAGFETGAPSEIEVGGRRLTRLESPLKRAERLIAEQRSAATQMALEERRAREAERTADREARAADRAATEEFQRQRDKANRDFQAAQNELNRQATMARAWVSASNKGTQRPPTAEQEKNYIYHALMSSANEELGALADNPDIRQWAITAYLNTPGAQFGRGLLNDAELQFIRAASDFTAGVNRRESGANVTKAELTTSFERFIEMGGEREGSARAKRAARARITEAMRLSALPATMWYGSAGSPPPAGQASNRPTLPYSPEED